MYDKNSWKIFEKEMVKNISKLDQSCKLSANVDLLGKLEHEERTI